MFFRCKHPAHCLHVAKDSTVVPDDKQPKDYNIVTHHLYCLKCTAEIDISYAQVIGGAEAMLARARQRQKLLKELNESES